MLFLILISTSAIDCLERLVSEMACCVSTGTLNPTHSLIQPCLSIQQTFCARSPQMCKLLTDCTQLLQLQRDRYGNMFVDCHAVVTCEIKLPWNNFKIVLVFYFTRNHVWNWNKIISATKAALTLSQNYFSNNERVGKYPRAAVIPWHNFEIIPRSEIKLFQTDVDEGWNSYEIVLFDK